MPEPEQKLAIRESISEQRPWEQDRTKQPHPFRQLIRACTDPRTDWKTRLKARAAVATVVTLEAAGAAGAIAGVALAASEFLPTPDPAGVIPQPSPGPEPFPPTH